MTEEYLLSDAEFSRVMSYQYKKSGQPRDELSERRIWQKLQKRETRRWSYALAALATAAALLIFLRPAEQPSTSTVKTGSEAREPSIEFLNGTELQIRVRVQEQQFLTVYASDEKGPPRRVLEPVEWQPGEARTLSLRDVGSWQRVCVLLAENQVELQRMEGMLDLTWNQLTDRQCLSR